MKNIFTLSIALILTLSTSAQEYYTGWDTPAEVEGWQQIRKGDLSVYEWSLDASSFVSPDSSLAHYYPVGGSVPTDDWYVSPVFDFSLGGSIDSLYKSYSGFGAPMEGDSIALYLLNGSDDPDVATKTILYSFTDSTYMNDNVWRKDSMISIPAVSGNSYLAFRYYTTNNWLDVKFDNLTVTALNGSGIDEHALEVTVYPNPSSDVIQLSGLDNLAVESITLHDYAGKLIRAYASDVTAYSVEGIPTGDYILKIKTAYFETSKIVRILP